MRAVTNADWPVDYYVAGPACADLTPETYSTVTKQIDAHRDLLKLRPGEAFECADRAPGARDGQLRNACPLDAAVKLTSQPCRPNDLGAYLIPAWDAVMLADALLPARPPAGQDYLTGLELAERNLSTADARAVVQAGRLKRPTIAVRMWHVDWLNDPSQVWERPGADLGLPTDPAPGKGGPRDGA